jgi:hypothetical protein
MDAAERLDRLIDNQQHYGSDQRFGSTGHAAGKGS